MGEFKLTPRVRIAIAVWLAVLAVLVVVTVLTEINSTVSGGLLGAWCGGAIAVVMVMRERAKKAAPSKLDRERYGRR
ncbi:hypothetical protein LWF15_16040 [Kineosporia rhizophila]|uniref:hypothetical protein n=1 Tax=Kineosporia TaxID=49184 RepID=UPI001E568DA4|nr:MULTISPECIES: hypothetical protein [Kineosporia]MCE0537013.1 hypothetical protein [Kineosporia rhizophila]GLY19156.1 hypothetical protein Kisp01_61700 [Kineosporia sp. NBRC 101677]